MTPATTRRRTIRRSDTRRRQSTSRPAAAPPTLFDAASGTPLASVVAPGGAVMRAVVDAPGVADTPGVVDAPDDTDETVRKAPMAGSGETLDRLVVGGWERLAARAEIPCLLCGGEMAPSYGAHATPIGGRCRDCATILS